MEQNDLTSWLEKNKTLLTYIVMGLVVVVILVSGTLSRYFTENPDEMEKVVNDITDVTTETENINQAANTTAIITPIVAEAGRGEVVFMFSSKNDAVIVREIHLHNPYKDSWVLAYDGYKTISTEPTEVYRTNLAAITYDRARVRTLDNFFTIESPVQVKDGDSVKVEWGI